MIFEEKSEWKWNDWKD